MLSFMMMALLLFGFLLVEIFPVPVLTVQEPGHQHGSHRVTAGVDERAARIEKLCHHQQHRQCDGGESVRRS